jgi:hypothetical protein
LARIVSILVHPRRMIRCGDYYGPEPRPSVGAAKPDFAAGSNETLLV